MAVWINFACGPFARNKKIIFYLVNIHQSSKPFILALMLQTYITISNIFLILFLHIVLAIRSTFSPVVITTTTVLTPNISM